MKPTKIPIRIPVVQNEIAMSCNTMRWGRFIMLSICSMLLFTSPMYAQTVSTIIGDGTRGYCCNGGPATAAHTYLPCSIAILSSGDMLITDENCIRKVSTSGTISLFAGTTVAGYYGDGGAATNAKFYGPQSIALDASGNIYFTDVVNNVVRKINTSGTIITVAGNGTAGYYGDNGPATAAELNQPECVTVDASGNLLITDYLNGRIRKVNTSGTITTIAGTGTWGYSGDGGQATAAELYTPAGIVTDASGNIYFTDYSNYTIRKINASGIITTIAGTGIRASRTHTGDGSPATSDSLLGAYGIALDGCGNIYFTEPSPGIIRKIDGSGILTTIAGIWTCGYNGDGSAATSTQFSSPMSIVFDASGNLLVPDFQNFRFRKITSVGQAPPQAAPTNNGPICSGGTVTLTANALNTTSYAWYGPSLSSSTVANPTATPSVTSIYTLTVTNSCTSGSATYTTTVSVYTLTPISGPTAVCAGSSITLTDAISGGTWSSGNTSVATVVSGTGVVTGVSAGTASIDYTKGAGCSVSAIITVNPLPAAIGGTASVCVGDITSLSDATSSGTWSSSNTSVGTVDGSGNVSGISAGTTTIAYTLSTGCAATVAIVVNPLPAPIGGTTSVCVNATTSLTDGTPYGTWSSSDVSIGTVDGSGDVTGISAGTATVAYTLSTGCAVTTIITVLPLPNPGTISGPTSVCYSGTPTITLTSNGDGGGTWTSDNSAIAAIDPATGVVTGASVGTVTMTYSVTNSCGTLYATYVVTVDGNPNAGTITGSDVCTGFIVHFTTSGDPGGAWASPDLTVSVGGVTGKVTGISAGTATVSYTVGNSCGSSTSTYTLNVKQSPHQISGDHTICSTAVQFTDPNPGGTWSSSDPIVASVGATTGYVTGNVLGGMATISYTISNGCSALFPVIVGVTCAPRSSNQGGNGTVTGEQHYDLYPSPNDGSFTLQQMITDAAPVKVIVMDATGRQMSEYETAFTDNTARIQLDNIATGLYLLQLTDSGGNRYTFKFVVSR